MGEKYHTLEERMKILAEPVRQGSALRFPVARRNCQDHPGLLPPERDRGIIPVVRRHRRPGTDHGAPARRAESTARQRLHRLRPRPDDAGYATRPDPRSIIVGANDTQFVVGATNEPDSEIIATIDRFMDNYGLRRPVFMSFDPVADTPLSGNKASPLWPHSELLRVPGIGPRTANRIVRGRLVFDYKQLAVMGVVLKRGRQFIIVAGHRQADLEAFS